MFPENAGPPFNYKIIGGGGGGKEGLEPAQPSQWWRPYNNKIEINKTFLLSNEMSISLGLLIFAS